MINSDLTTNDIIVKLCTSKAKECVNINKKTASSYLL